MIECQKKPERELKKRLGGNVEETGRSVSNLKFLFICQWILEGRAYYGDVLSERVEIGYCPSHQQDGGRSTALGNLLHGLLLQRNQISLCRLSDYGDHVSQVVFGHWLCLEALAYTL